MSNSITIAIIAGLGGMLGWGFADFFAKKTIDKIGDVASLLWAHTLAASVLSAYIIFVLIKDGTAGFPDNFSGWLGVAFFGFLQAIVYIFVYKAFAKGKLAVLNPIFSSYAGLVALLSIFVFGEAVTGNIVLALLLLFCGILLMNLDLDGLKVKKLKLDRQPGLVEIGIATVLATVWTVYWAHFIAGKNWKIYASLMYIFMTLTVIIYAKSQKNESLKVKDKTVWKYLAGIGIGEAVAYISISYGFGLTSHVSIVALLSGAFALPAVILAAVFLKEKIHLLQTIAIILILCGVALVAVI
ncbi:MAG TPA: EamA family transporter [Candidatus Saccharimonadales bacterium]|nr:EamA family transporter [Candidatus Saccharimonadales bacterium]